MKNRKDVRYAVVGLGSIAQEAVLPGFQHAKNSRLTALVSDDPTKLRVLGKKYGVTSLYDYRDYDRFLRDDVADAVYIALPNTLHRDFAVRAAKAGRHVLCEKPMATSTADCDAMISAARDHGVLLMVAYRLHFDPANLEAIALLKAGRVGDVRIFNSTFSRQVETGDIRLQQKLGGGTLWDMGIYCINAARYLFQANPTHAFAKSVRGTDPRFREVDEMTTAVLRFPGDRLAAFTSSFGAADSGAYDVIGTKGRLRLEPAYEHAFPLAYTVTVNDKAQTKKFSKHDQFGAELLYFSDCVLSKKTPEPSGVEGRIDVAIISALLESAKSGRLVALPFLNDKRPPQANQKIALPGVKKPDLVASGKSH